MIKSVNILYRDISDLTAKKNKVSSYLGNNILIQVFTGILDIKIISRLLKDIQEVYPDIPVIGTSTAGEIMNSDALENSIVVNISIFSHTVVKSVLIHQNDDSNKASRDIAKQLNRENIKVVIVFGCGTKDGKFINDKPFLDSLASELPGVVIAGGQAGEKRESRNTLVFTEQGIVENGFAVASLSGSRLKVNNAYNLSWIPIGKKMTITEVEGNRVYSIDNKSPLDIYRHYLNLGKNDSVQHMSVDFPLITERDGLLITNAPIWVNEDGSFEFIQNLHTGEQLRFGFCHAGLLAEDAARLHKELHDFKPQIVFIYSCVSRKWVLGQDIACELSSVSVFPNTAGFFSYGEYYTAKSGKPHFFHQTMTTLALSECDGDILPSTPKIDTFSSKIEESRQFRALKVLHRLVETSTNEIEAMNMELAELANKDALTGLANRRLFDEILFNEAKRHGRSNEMLSLLLIDVDFFKQFNDTYGHISGDDCLRGVSQVIRETVSRPSDTAARYGGEEFACILPLTNHKGALRLAESLRTRIENLCIPHSSSSAGEHVTVSIGVLTIDSTVKDISPQSIVKSCDDLLYTAKDQGRNRVVGKILSS